jgi:hypothetical protein
MNDERTKYGLLWTKVSKMKNNQFISEKGCTKSIKISRTKYSSDFELIYIISPIMFSNVLSSIALLRIGSKAQVEKIVNLFVNSDSAEISSESTLASKCIDILYENGFLKKIELLDSVEEYTLTKEGEKFFSDDKYSQFLEFHAFYIPKKIYFYTGKDLDIKYIEQNCLINDALIGLCSEYLDVEILFSAEYYYCDDINTVRVSDPTRVHIIPGSNFEIQSTSFQSFLNDNPNDTIFIVTRSINEVKNWQLILGKSRAEIMILMISNDLSCYNHEGAVQLQNLLKRRQKPDRSQKRYHEDLLNDFFSAFKPKSIN